ARPAGPARGGGRGAIRRSRGPGAGRRRGRRPGDAAKRARGVTGRTIRRYPDPEAGSRGAAHDFVELARGAIADRGRFCVALSGGSTPRRMYEILSEAPRWAQLPWERVEFFWGDERAVPPDHPDSNFGAAAASLLRKLAIPEERIHRMQGEL